MFMVQILVQVRKGFKITLETLGLKQHYQKMKAGFKDHMSTRGVTTGQVEYQDVIAQYYLSSEFGHGFTNKLRSIIHALPYNVHLFAAMEKEGITAPIDGRLTMRYEAVMNDGAMILGKDPPFILPVGHMLPTYRQEHETKNTQMRWFAACFPKRLECVYIIPNWGLDHITGGGTIEPIRPINEKRTGLHSRERRLCGGTFENTMFGMTGNGKNPTVKGGMTFLLMLPREVEEIDREIYTPLLGKWYHNTDIIQGYRQPHTYAWLASISQHNEVNEIQELTSTVSRGNKENVLYPSRQDVAVVPNICYRSPGKFSSKASNVATRIISRITNNRYF